MKMFPLISGATAIDYLNMDLSDLESRVDKTIYTYNPTLDDVKKVHCKIFTK